MEINKETYLNALRLIIEKDEVFNHVESLINSYDKINFINNNQAICKNKKGILEIIINGDKLLILSKTHDRNYFEKIEYILKNNQIEIDYEYRKKVYNELLDMNYFNEKKEQYIYTVDFKLLLSEKTEVKETTFNDEKMKHANDKVKLCETLYLMEDDSYFRYINASYDKDAIINKYEVSNKKINNLLRPIDVFDSNFNKVDKIRIKNLSLWK